MNNWFVLRFRHRRGGFSDVKIIAGPFSEDKALEVAQHLARNRNLDETFTAVQHEGMTE